MKKKKVAVVGAGPAGLTLAYQLSKHSDFDVSLFEASSGVGGMSKSFELWGQIVDLGPHRFFSSDPRVNKLWLEVVGKNYVMVDRLTRIFYKKKFFYYPLKAFNALKNLGIGEAIHCVLSYVLSRIFPKKNETGFENWIRNRFGTRLYQIFFKTYSEKLWGISCSDLDADFATQRIKKLSLYEAIKNAILGGRGNTHKTLVDQFAYPNNGTGYAYEQMLEIFKKQGGKCFFNMPIQKAFMKDAKTIAGLEFFDGRKEEFEHIVSSMPLSLLVSRLDFVPAEVSRACDQLKFRNTILVYLKVEKDKLFPDQWLYVHSDDLQMGRVTNFANWSQSIRRNQRNTILVLEYWCYDADSLWQRSQEELIKLAESEIRRTGLVRDAVISAGHVVKLHRSYPVYNLGYKRNLKIVEDYLKGLDGLDVIGRYGSFKYNNQDHSILMGLLLAENLVHNSKINNLWEINTDYEYQESSTITESGLA